jgi:hypothetical protein
LVRVEGEGDELEEGEGVVEGVDEEEVKGIEELVVVVEVEGVDEKEVKGIEELVVVVEVEGVDEDEVKGVEELVVVVEVEGVDEAEAEGIEYERVNCIFIIVCKLPLLITVGSIFGVKSV